MIAVVSGLPRSGTSLLMQMLEAGGVPPLADPPSSPLHRAADASNPRGYYELHAVRSLRAGAPWVHQAEGRAVKVVAPLLAHLPAGHRYRVVFVLRDLDEILASQSAMLERLGRPSLPAGTLRHAFAHQVDAARALLDGHERFSALYVQHADLIARPSTAAAGIASFLQQSGTRLDIAAMARVVDLSLYRARPGG